MKKAGVFRDDVKVRDSFFRGVTATAGSIRFIGRNRGLMKYFIIPFFINILVLVLAWYAAFVLVYGPLSRLAAGPEWYFQALRAVMAPLIIVALGIVVVLIYSVMGSIITAPFNDFLSQRAEEILTGETFDEPFSMSVFLSDIIRIIKNTAALLALLVAINILLLALNLVPAAGSVVYSGANVVMTFFFIGFQFFDFPLERRRYRFGEKMRVAWRFKRSVMGVGASFFIMAFVPLLGFLALGLGTVGAARLFVERIGPALRRRPAARRAGSGA